MLKSGKKNEWCCFLGAVDNTHQMCSEKSYS